MSGKQNPWDEVEDKLRDLYHVSRIKRVDGGTDYVAGQRNIAHTDYRLDLKADVVQTIENEFDEQPDDISETLSSLHNRLELELDVPSEFTVCPGDYETGHLYVQVSRDRRPGGSY